MFFLTYNFFHRFFRCGNDVLRNCLYIIIIFIIFKLYLLSPAVIHTKAEEFNHFSYSGPLFAGEIKFPTEIVHDWSGEFLLAPTANCEPTENGTYVVGNSPDNKWVIPVAGNWQIDIHADKQTISFQQQ